MLSTRIELRQVIKEYMIGSFRSDNILVTPRLNNLFITILNVIKKLMVNEIVRAIATFSSFPKKKPPKKIAKMIISVLIAPETRRMSVLFVDWNIGPVVEVNI